MSWRVLCLTAVAVSVAACSAAPTPPPAVAPTGTPAPAGAEAGPVDSPAATRAGTPLPTAIPLVVSGTGADGVSIRRAPGPSGEFIRAWLEGTEMTPLGERRQADGRAWTRVRDPDGNEGWVASDFLAPKGSVTPAAVPTATPEPAASPTAGALPTAATPGLPDPSGGRVAPLAGNCPEDHPIKGDRDAGVYHTRSSPAYGETIAGDCFASEDDARAAGYRAHR